MRRDCIDMARAVLGRLLEGEIARIGLAIDSRRHQPPEAAVERKTAADDAIRRPLATLRQHLDALADVLETMPEFSLNDSLARIHAAGPSNPDFETTLKRNASAWYCRSQIYEMIRFMVRRQFEVLSRFLEDSMAEKDGFSNWSNRMRELEKQLDAQVEVFNARPLADMKPDCAAALGRLPKVLRCVAELR